MDGSTGKIYTRGLARKTQKEIIVDRGLGISNPSSSQNKSLQWEEFTPPGYFFSSEAIRAAESWAKMVADRQKELACTIIIEVTPENFDVIKGKISNVGMGSIHMPLGRDEYTYDLVNTYDELKKGQVAIEVGALSDQDLRLLHTVVGFYNKELDCFEYELYADLADKFLQEGVVNSESQVHKRSSESF